MKRILPYILSAVLLAAACTKNDEEPAERPLTPTVGAINARYSVSDSTTVVFSRGNLQYQASNNTWRFAIRQYDFIGAENGKADTHYTGWIDLFGWGTSGYNGLMPYSVDDTASHYGNGGQLLADIANTYYDWGRFNTISNADSKSFWRTLTYDEWNHLLNFREGASLKKALATLVDVNGYGDIPGLLLLPDHWDLPAGCSFTNGSAQGFATNRYTYEQWELMEQGGAVFLPAAGYRTGRKVDLMGVYGGYWTSSMYYFTTAYDIFFDDRQFGISNDDKSNGQCVRLVTNK